MDDTTIPKNPAARKGRGRSAPRSRNGCDTCRQRRVRCDERRPLCGHCTRLDLECVYRKNPRRLLAGQALVNTNPGLHAVDPFYADPFTSHVLESPSGFEGAGRAIGDISHLFSGRWADQNLFTSSTRTFDAADGQNALSSFTFADVGQAALGDDYGLFRPEFLDAGDSRETVCHPHVYQNSTSAPVAQGRDVAALQGDGEGNAAPGDGISFNAGSDFMHSKRSEYLLSCFLRITQPPASILITGVRKWRRLQDYFIRMSRRHRAVAGALLALIELLAKDDVSYHRSGANPTPALRLREAAQEEIELEMTKAWEGLPKIRDALLAALFLLAWFEVIRDQGTDQSLFPSALAERILIGEVQWNPYSKQLLQWFNILDSKACHLGGQHLLSQKCLEVVSKHRPQIIAGDGSDEEGSGNDQATESLPSPQDQGVSPNPSPQDSYDHPNTHHPSPPFYVETGPPSNVRQMKQTLLNTILQPALDWYLVTQTYCRRIGSHDRHHRTRFTVKDEYEVVISCKRIELELIHLWRQRPMVIRLSAAQLSDMVSGDIALRLEEIFSLYMASFWVLFVFLHRVVWFHLPHSDITHNALGQTWSNLQRSYGEMVGGARKIVHPALLWPLFMFGSECVFRERRDWAIEQLEALGDARTVVGDDDGEGSLPPFRLSVGATRNAKRAAVLLRELTKRQDEQKGRVDDRDLSMELFGCHFSII